jgi:hypothetical protein
MGAVALLMLFAAGSDSASPAGARDAAVREGEFIVSWAKTLDRQGQDELLRSMGGEAVEHFRRSNGSWIRLPDAAALRLLGKSPHVRSIAPNRVITVWDGLKALSPKQCTDCSGGGRSG